MATAAIIAAGAARALDDLLYAFRAADATAATRARSLSDLGIAPSTLLSRLERAGVVKAGVDPGTHYLDERELRVFSRRQPWRVTFAIGVGLLLMAAALALIARR